jgi:hypothetical protein
MSSSGAMLIVDARREQPLHRRGDPRVLMARIFIALELQPALR